MPQTKNIKDPKQAGENFYLTRVSLLRDSGFKLFLSNLRDFLTERPVKPTRGGPSAFESTRFGASLKENFKECLQPLPPSVRRRANSDLMVSPKPWFASFWENIRDTVAPRKLPPLKVTSQPVDVPEIWTKNQQFTKVQALSFAFHVLVAVLIILPLLPEFMSPPTQANTERVIPVDISPYLAKLSMGNKRAGGGGGGGNRDIKPASRGRLPKFAMNQLTPPVVKPIEHPKLAVTPTVIVPPDIHLPNPNLPNNGDPLEKLVTDSNGPGSGAGIGSGSGGGVGSGQGGGVGPGQAYGTGGGYPEAGQNGYGAPTCLYCPPPQFSDAAFKLKIQGVVVLDAIIGPDGRAYNVHVYKGLGYGLDQEAIKSVQSIWHFNPAIGPDGKPTAVHTLVEVDFNIY